MTPEDIQNQLENRSPEDMERLAFLGTLAEGLAHEIRNPLSTINVNLQLLKEDWKDPETEREEMTVERIKSLLDETERLEEVLNNFLQFAQGKDLELEDLDLNSYLDEILELFEAEAEKSNITIQREYASGLPLVSIDPAQFQQAIVNVFRNTKEALEETGGEMVVRTEERSDGSVRCAIEDNGEGIPPEKLDKVFEVYYSTKKGGSGLGLPIAKRLVQEHGGHIDIVSQEGEGTTVTIVLPPAESEESVSETTRMTSDTNHE